MPRTKSEPPPPIARTNVGARNHAHARIIFATFCKSLQLLNFLFTFAMKTAIDERNAGRQGKLSRGSVLLKFGAFKGLFWAGIEKSLILGCGKFPTVRKIFFLRNVLP